jgi:hypothetical protein
VKRPHLPAADVDPPKELFAAVGEIVLRWSRLEYQLGVLVRVVVSATKQKQYRELSRKRTRELCALLDLLAPSLVADAKVASRLLSFARSVESAEKIRNDYVHSIYGEWTDKLRVPMRFRLATADKDGNLKASGYDVKQIDSFAVDVAELQDEAQAVTEVLKGKPERLKIRRR